MVRPDVAVDEDVLALLDGLGVAGTHDPESDQEAIAAAEWEAWQGYDKGSAVSPVLVAEHLPAGPGLAALLAQDPPADASDWDLPGLAASYRRLAGGPRPASWPHAPRSPSAAPLPTPRSAPQATAGPEPAAGGSRRGRAGAGYDPARRLGLDCPGLPAALGAARTGAALSAGRIDLPRARIIAEATTPLSGEHAAQVEARVLPPRRADHRAATRCATPRRSGYRPRRRRAAPPRHRTGREVCAISRRGRHRDIDRVLPARRAGRRRDGPDHRDGPRAEVLRRARLPGPAARAHFPRLAAGYPAGHPPGPRRPAR